MVRRYTFIVLTGCLAALAAHGQPPPKALLWSITAPGSVDTSYLYGTVHSRDERAFHMVGRVEERLVEARTVAGELDLEASRKAGLQLMGAMMLPDGATLESLYRKKEWKELEPFLRRELGAMAPLFMRMKPFFVLATLSEAAMPQDRPRVLDDHLLSTAQEQGQRVIGLETLQEQLRALDVLPLKEQATMLLDQARRNDHRQQLEELMQAYMAQDLEALMAITERSGGMPAELERALLTERNERMVQRMDSVMRVDERAMFLVGAAHLPGEQGIIEGLKGRGWMVRPVATRPEE